MIKYKYEPLPMNNWGSPSLIENICDHVFQNKTKIDKKTNSFYMWHSLCKLLTSFSRSQSKGPGKSQHNCQSVKTLRFSATKLLSPKVCNTCENGNGLQTKHNNLFWTVTFLKLCQKKSFPTRLLISRPMQWWCEEYQV